MVRKVKVSVERKSSPSLSVNAPAAHAHNIPASTSESCEGLPSSSTPCLPPASPSRKKAFLSEPEKAAQTSATSSHTHHPQDVEENKGWVDDCVYEKECSVDKEVIHGEITCHPFSTSLPNQLELNSNCHSPFTVATSKKPDVPKKPQGHSSPAALVLKKELSEEGKGEKGKTSDSDDDGRVLAKGSQDGRAVNMKAMRALAATPGERPGRSILQMLVSPISSKNSIGETLMLSKPPRSTLGKRRTKSFSSADFTRSDGQKLNSFRRLLELKLSVKTLPKLLAKGGQSLDCTAADAEAEQCVNGGGQDINFQDHLGMSGARKFSCPQLGVIEVGVEQSMDEFRYLGAAQAPEMEYENVWYCEEIPEYVILPLGLGSGGTVGTPPDQSDWHNHLYYDNIYEEQELYHPLEKHTEHQQQKHSERSSIDEDVGQMDDGQSEEKDIMVHSLDEDDDTSSSNKGEPEQHGEREADSGAKESKVVHIAREIMSSEYVLSTS
ncbi:FYVE, RhoGEF and PH domain-containing protein 6 [Salmo salar]|uniref:FYVE, RhoGEF and PH domain-containing protein 6 n=1 Tax=Salmo salar TaxID=8030 RepID=A0A1S3MJR3_SALSA|nr:FYVE, RhoGEF and PH domain-containing protein 6 [Salmo salar]